MNPVENSKAYAQKMDENDELKDFRSFFWFPIILTEVQPPNARCCEQKL